MKFDRLDGLLSYLIMNTSCNFDENAVVISPIFGTVDYNDWFSCILVLLLFYYVGKVRINDKKVGFDG